MTAQSKEHCARMHPWAGNEIWVTYPNGKTYRKCRLCRNESSRNSIFHSGKKRYPTQFQLVPKVKPPKPAVDPPYWEKYARHVRNVVAKYVSNVDDQQDLVQNVWVRLMERKTTEPVLNMRYFTGALARCVAYEFHKKKNILAKRFVNRDDLPLDPNWPDRYDIDSGLPTPEAIVLRWEELQRAQAFIDQYAAKYGGKSSAAFYRYIEGYDVPEIALNSGVALNTAWGRVKAVRRAINKSLTR